MWPLRKGFLDRKHNKVYPPMKTTDLAAMLSRPQFDEFLMHPNTWAAIQKPLLAAMPDEISRLALRMAVRTSPFLKERDIEEKWEPPASGRFCELGPEDESWARFFGIGKVLQIDKGPLIYKLNPRLIFSNSIPGVFSSPMASVITSCV